MKDVQLTLQKFWTEFPKKHGDIKVILTEEKQSVHCDAHATI